jgi:hypothetical protein
VTSAKSHFYRLAPLAVLLLLAAVVYLNPGEKQSGPVQRLDCPSLSSSCTGRMDGRTVTVGVQGNLKALQPFDLWVRAKDAARVQARFTMEGMDMGFNLYTLHPDRDGVFRARVTLPVCVSGRRNWLMTLDIDGRQMTVPFVTEL